MNEQCPRPACYFLTMRFSTPSIVALLTACAPGSPAAEAPETSPARTVTAAPGEIRFKSIRQITFSGENAEAYFSPDGELSLIHISEPTRPY